MTIDYDRDQLAYALANALKERDEAREALEAVNALEEMHAKPGSMEIAIKQNPAQAQWVAKCFASMVAASPNYTEMKFDLVAKEEKWEWLTVLIQKGNGQTPHQLRQKAENERDEARDLADRYRVAYCSLKEYSVITPFPWEEGK